MNIPTHIFRNYDIRGLTESELTPDVCELIGKAFGTYSKMRFGENIVVGHDDRASSPILKDRFVFGLLSTGCNVYDIGLSLTPIVQFLTFNRRFNAAAIITASHNPVQFNGLRFVGKNGESVFGEELQEIYRIITENEFAEGNGVVNYEDLNELYETYLLENFKFSKKIKTVINCGNGTSSFLAQDLFTKAGVDVVPLNCEIDSTFPNGIPDPENSTFMKKLSNIVLENKAEVGFGFDTDADRYGVVDDKGVLYHADKIMLLFAKHILKENKGAKIAFDVKSTLLLEKYISLFGGNPVFSRTGHPYFVNAIKNSEILAASEYSGHAYFGDKYFGYDDGLYAALRVLEILDKENKLLSELMSEFPKTYQIHEIKIPCEDDNKENLLLKITEFSKKHFNAVKTISVDGLRLYPDEDTWFLVRKSNTTPNLTFRAESMRKENLEAILEAFKGNFSEFKEISAEVYFS